MAARIKKGDHVVVMVGKDKGRRGKVLRVLSREGKAVVEDVNIVRRHQRQTQTQEGGIVSKSLPVNLSNLALEDPADGKPVRVGYKILDDGRKVRYARRSGEVIDG